MNWFMFLIPIMFTIISLQICYIFYKEQSIQKSIDSLSLYEWSIGKWKQVTANLMVQIIFYVITSMLELNAYVFLFIIPIQFIFTFAIFYPSKQHSNFIVGSFKILKSGLMSLFAINLGFLLLSFGFFMLVSTVLYQFIYDAITMNLTNEVVSSDNVYIGFFLITITFIVALSFIFFCLYQGVFYFSQKEKHTAEGLIEQLENLGNKTKRYALEK